MAIIGYARVSTADQDLTLQLDALREAGCERVFQEKASGRKGVDERPALDDCLGYLREGDVFIFTRIDRVARSLAHLITILNLCERKGVQVKCLLQPIDTTTPEGRLVAGILGAVAEFEVDLKRERQREGIERAKKEGKYKGAPGPRITRADIAAHRAAAIAAGQHPSASRIARLLKCDKTTIYRNHPDGWGRDPMEGKRDGRPRINGMAGAEAH